MESNTIPQRPDWLTDEKIAKYRGELADCPNPMTDDELSNWNYDGYNDTKRLNARRAYDILSHFGLLEEEEDE